MRFVGIDLAWGGRRPSGLAVLDPGGAVVAEGWATGDEEIGGFLAVHDPGGAVVALDAPLVVGNPAGTRRGCEAELQRGYGRVGAGPYPTNLGLLDARVVGGTPAGTCGGGGRGWGRGGRGGAGRGPTRPTWGCSGGGCGRWSWCGGRPGRT